MSESLNGSALNIARKALEIAGKVALNTVSGGGGTVTNQLLSTGNSANSIYIYANGGTEESIGIISEKGTENAIDIESMKGRVFITSKANFQESIYVVANGGTLESVRIESQNGTNVGDDASVLINSYVGGITLSSSANQQSAIYVHTNGGTEESIVLRNEKGTSGAIILQADKGSVIIESKQNDTKSVYLKSNGGTNEQVLIESLQGDSAISDHNSIQLTSVAGAIGLTSNYSGDEKQTAIELHTNGSDNTVIKIHAETSTATAGSDDSENASVQLYSDVGGIGLYSGINASRSIRMLTDGGTNASIEIVNPTGEGDAIKLTATNGNIAMNSTKGSIGLYTEANASNSIYLHTNGGENDTIKLYSQASTVAGGGDAGDIGSIMLYSELGSIGMYSGADSSDAIRICVNGGGSSTINMRNETGSGDAITITSVYGNTRISSSCAGISLTSNMNMADSQNITLRAEGGIYEQILIESLQGRITDDGAGTASIQLSSYCGGVSIYSGYNDVNYAHSIYLHSNGGAGESICLYAEKGETIDDGSGQASIILKSDYGGVSLLSNSNNANAIRLQANNETNSGIKLVGGNISLNTISNNTKTIYLNTNGGVDNTSENITLECTNGTEDNAIELISSKGGITLDASSVVTVTKGMDVGGNVQITGSLTNKINLIKITGSMSLSSGDSGSTLLNISGAGAGVTLPSVSEGGYFKFKCYNGNAFIIAGPDIGKLTPRLTTILNDGTVSSLPVMISPATTIYVSNYHPASVTIECISDNSQWYVIGFGISTDNNSIFAIDPPLEA
uniref:Uncharacterized protein n=1 Tax=viral metagenome TaxID=1070528 RepID=A0A6C0ECA0_9ZZZZ